jgi:hypothetical protein
MTTESSFPGFPQPEANWSKLPHAFIDALPLVETQAELRVILYLLRHTWGCNEFGKPKKLTLDAFEHGCRKRDRTRVDHGVGMCVSAGRRSMASSKSTQMIGTKHGSRSSTCSTWHPITGMQTRSLSLEARLQQSRNQIPVTVRLCRVQRKVL